MRRSGDQMLGLFVKCDFFEEFCSVGADLLLNVCWIVVLCVKRRFLAVFSCDCCRSLISVWIRCEGQLK